MQVRLATINDVENISTLYEHFYAYNANQQPQYYKEAVESVGYPKYSIESNQDDIFVAIEDNTLIGFVHVKEDKTSPYDMIVQHKFAEVVDVFVEGPFRGHGVGPLLISAAKQWAKMRGLDYLELFVLTENENSRQFYEHVGFSAVSTNMRLLL